MVPARSRPLWPAFDQLGLAPGRPSRHGAAQPLGGRDDALGLPVRRAHHHAAQLARRAPTISISASTMPTPRRSCTRTSPRRAMRGVEASAEPRAHRGRRGPAGRALHSRARGRPDATTPSRAPTPSAWSVMLYTSGTTARPKGVPRRQRAERAAALAHVAQNLYRQHERTLGRDAALSHHGGALAAWRCRSSAAPSSACRASTSRARSS